MGYCTFQLKESRSTDVRSWWQQLQGNLRQLVFNGCHAMPFPTPNSSQLPSAWPKRNRDLRRLQGSIQRCSQDMKLLKCHLMWNLNPTRKWSNSWSNSSLSPYIHDIYIYNIQYSIYIYNHIYRNLIGISEDGGDSVGPMARPQSIESPWRWRRDRWIGLRWKLRSGSLWT